MADCWEDDWEPILDYTPSYDDVDFDRELFGTTARDEMYEYGDRRGFDQLPPGFGTLPGKRGQEWLGRNFPAGAPRGDCGTSQEKEKVCSVDSHTGFPSSASVCGVQIDGCSGRRDSGNDSVSVMWPDPITGCVYGGHCALQFLRSSPGPACQHPPILKSDPLCRQDALHVCREFTPITQGGRRKFASFLRWRSHKRKFTKRFNSAKVV